MSAKRTAIQDLQQKVVTLEQSLREAQERIAALHVVQEVAQSLTSELHLQPLLRKILAAAVEVMTASAGSLILFEPLTNELIFAVTEGGGGERLIGRRIQLNQGIAGWVATNRQPLIVDDVNQDNRYYQAVADAVFYHVNSILCVPMISHNKLIGVLQLLHSQPGKYFNTLDQQLLTTFANQSAIAIENARLHENLISERDHIIAVEDEVRKRLARDLHDGPTQLVSSIVMNMSFIKQLFKYKPDEIMGEIERTTTIANRAIKQLRTLMFDLRPVILETQGLVPALEVYGERLNEIEKFQIKLAVEPEPFPRLAAKAEQGVFGVIQEAINNAKKYAEASQIDLIVRANEAYDQVTVLIKDNGVGFDVRAVQERYDERGSLGMINSRERAEAVKGTFSIHSEIGQGTEVSLRFPLSENILHEEKDD